MENTYSVKHVRDTVQADCRINEIIIQKIIRLLYSPSIGCFHDHKQIPNLILNKFDRLNR